jgi:hypothetical protein
VRPPPALLRSLLVALPLACTACPGTLEDPERFTDGAGGSASGCPDIASTLLVPTCAKSGCHSATDKAQGLDLESPDVAARLVGVKSTEGAGLLVDPSAPATSVLYTKLTTIPPFGSRMPLAGTPVDGATLACVLEWVSASAADAGPIADASTASPGAGADAGADAGAGVPSDAAPSEARAPEGGPREAAAPDAGPRDAGPRDAASPEGSTDASDAGAG